MSDIKGPATTQSEAASRSAPLLFSRKSLLTGVLSLTAISATILGLVFKIQAYDFLLPAIVTAIALVALLLGQWIRYRLRISLRAALLMTAVVCAGLAWWIWDVEDTHRETEFVRQVLEEGGSIEYDGTDVDSSTGLFKTSGGWEIPGWTMDVLGESYFKRLRTLNLGAEFGDDDIQRLQAVRSVEQILLFNTAVTSEGVASLPLLPGVEFIHLDWQQVSPESTARLKEFRDFTQLNIYGDQGSFATAAGDPIPTPLRALAGLDQLEMLYADTPSLSLEDVAALAALPNLKHIFIYSPTNYVLTDIETPDALLELAKSQSLEFLALRFSSRNVTLEELQALAEIPTLKRLIVTRWNRQPFAITQEQLDELRKAHPAIKFDVSPLAPPPAAMTPDDKQ